MNFIYKIIFIAFIFVLFALMMSGCAVIVPPGGGPRDTLPPILLNANPSDSSTNFSGRKIEMVFNEYIQLENVQQKLIVSPIVKTMPTVSSYLEKITIQFKEPLDSNTTYSFDFGNSIKDANEGNPFKNYIYAISTGSKLDTETLSGKVTLAETGGVDSTLIAVLYNNLSDTAIYKAQPRYYTRLDSAGRFTFRYLPVGQTFNLFALPNTYMKNYADSTMLFAFYNTPIVTGTKDSTGIELFAYQEYKETQRKRILSESQIKKQREEDAKKPLNVTVSAKSEEQSLINDLYINYSKPLATFNAGSILLSDTNYVRIPNYRVEKNRLDSNYSSFALKTTWAENADYILIIPQDAAVDSFGTRLSKADTVRFKTKSNREYASFTMIFPDVDLNKKPVVQLLRNNNVVDSMAIGENRRVIREMYEPGDYQLRILYDTNGNLRWDPGNYKLKRPPEIVIPHKKTINFRANWENELEIFINK